MKYTQHAALIAESQRVFGANVYATFSLPARGAQTDAAYVILEVDVADVPKRFSHHLAAFQSDGTPMFFHGHYDLTLDRAIEIHSEKLGNIA